MRGVVAALLAVLAAQQCVAAAPLRRLQANASDGSPTTSHNGRAFQAPRIGDVGVDAEFGDIREMVLGIPWAFLPAYNKMSWGLTIEPINRFLPDEEKVTPEYYVAYLANRSSYEILLPVNDCNPADHESGPGKKPCKYWLVKEEFDYFEAKLRELVPSIIIHRPLQVSLQQAAVTLGERWVPEYAGIVQTYTRDEFIVVGRHVIELSTSAADRRAGALGLRRLLDDRLAGVQGIKHVAMPPVDWSQLITVDPISGNVTYDKTPAAVLEGGDVIVYGYRVFVGVSLNPGVGSSEKGYLWLKQLLEPEGYQVEMVPLQPFMLHLDVALSLPARNVVLYCADAFAAGVPPAFFTDRRRFTTQIPVSLSETKYLAVNGMPVNERHYFIATSPNFNENSPSYRAIEARLVAAGIAVTSIPYARHVEDGGALRCSYQPLKRALAARGKGQRGM